MDGWMDEWMDGWTDGWMDGWMDGCPVRWMKAGWVNDRLSRMDERWKGLSQNNLKNPQNFP